MNGVKPQGRVQELDALRGLAALAVVLYHYLTRYDELFSNSLGSERPLHVACPWGQYGVDLFFMISGYVILMTLERTRSVGEFVWNRFSRLYPAYWVAAAVTFTVTTVTELPGQVVTPLEALLNLTMIPNLFGARLIDGVYWTLQAEVLFYLAMLLVHRLGLFRWLPQTMLCWLGVAVAIHGYHLFVHGSIFAESSLSIWQTYLSLKFIQSFAVGILFYDVQRNGTWTMRHVQCLGLAALICVLLNDEFSSLYAISLAIIFYGAINGQVAWLVRRPLLWLGSISYTLYLVHQNMGYATIRWCQMQNWEPHVCVLLTLMGALIAASLLTRYVEQPSLRFLKNFRRPSQSGPVHLRPTATTAGR